MPSAGFESTYFSAPKAGKENDAPLNGNIPPVIDPLKKENEDLRRQNEQLRLQLELLNKKYQTDVEERVNILQQENFNLKIQIESMNIIINQYKEEEKDRETSAKQDVSMENINSKLGDMNVKYYQFQYNTLTLTNRSNLKKKKNKKLKKNQQQLQSLLK